MKRNDFLQLDRDKIVLHAAWPVLQSVTGGTERGCIGKKVSNVSEVLLFTG